MGLETGTYIDDLVISNPDGATDGKDEGDDHLRLIKKTIKNTFPNIDGAVDSTQDELNTLDGYLGNVNDHNVLRGAASAGIGTTHIAYLAGLTSTIQTQIDDIKSFNGALVYKSTIQAINSFTVSAWSVISFDLESYDTDTIHDNVTNNARLTVPAGITKIRLSAQVAWTSLTGTGIVVSSLSKNDDVNVPSSVVGLVEIQNSGSSERIQHLQSSVLSVIGGDYFTIHVQQTTGASNPVKADTSSLEHTWFAMEILE